MVVETVGNEVPGASGKSGFPIPQKPTGGIWKTATSCKPLRGWRMDTLSTFPVRTTGTTSLYLNKHCGFQLAVAAMSVAEQNLKSREILPVNEIVGYT
jgi:hypothetical protein